MKKAVIIAGGNDIMHSDVSCILKDAEIIVCADSGYDNCQKMNIVPHMILGDMDSVKTIPDNLPLFRVPAEKDLTDTQLCIDYLYENGYHNIVLLCALGGRSDHMFANLMLLGYAAEKGVRLIIKNDTETVFLCEKDSVLDICDGKTFSVFAVGSDCTGVCETGAKYPLENACIKAFSTLGVSNEITGKTAKVSVKTGRLMIVQTKLID